MFVTGSIIDQSAVCGNASSLGAGIRIEGDGAAIVVSRSNVGMFGGSVTDDGISMEDCFGRSPWIGDNTRIWAEGPDDREADRLAQEYARRIRQMVR